MNKGLERELKKMNNAEFNELRHLIRVGSKLRVIKREYDVTNKDIASRLSVQEPEVKKILNGCYPVDVKLVAVIEAYEDELYNDPIEYLEEE